MVLSVGFLIMIGMVGKLPKERQKQARLIGMTLALVPRRSTGHCYGRIVG